jgi:saccharopine dehydrogenase-like NADP-dependent oxidoreductase
MVINLLFMKQLLVFGAGKSATVLISYLVKQAANENWLVTVVDANIALAQSKIGDSSHAKAVSFDIHDATARGAAIQKADIVISLLPPALHFLVAKDCVLYKKHLLTASYIDDSIKSLEKEVAANDLLFLCEMGLDPGIDHMSAMQLFDEIKAQQGHIHSFRSHCGGLVAPESDDNPWHYKISWNPRNVVLAGKAGATFREHGETRYVAYEELFSPDHAVTVKGQGDFCYYPNRDSLGYINIYGLQDTHTFIRTTLRKREFCIGWQQIVAAGLTDEHTRYDTTKLTYRQFFTQFLHAPLHISPTDAALFQQQMDFLSTDTLINKGDCTAADVLQYALERQLVLHPSDKDMIVMLHEIGWDDVNGKSHNWSSSLVVKGEDSLHTAMAKTVGLPLGIAAKLILEGRITLRGLHIPIVKEIYEPVLQELKGWGVVFEEEKL